MTAAWLPGPMLAFDLETTGPEPETARIVQAALVECGPGGAVARKWLVNPGVPIPPAATAIHGITDEIAATGHSPESVVLMIDSAILKAASEGTPLVIMCAHYDLAVFRVEAARLGLTVAHGPVLDPLVIDRGCDRYRKGPRKLVNLAEHYGVKAGDAHDAAGDALTAARVVWRQARRYPLIADFSLEQMQAKQAEWHRAWAEGFEAFLRSQGKPADISTDWPISQNRKEAA